MTRRARITGLVSLFVGLVMLSPACENHVQRQTVAYCRELVVEIGAARDAWRVLEEDSFASLVGLMSSDRLVFCASLREEGDATDPSVQRYRRLTGMLFETVTAHWLKSGLGRSITASYPGIGDILEEMQTIARSVADAM